MENSRSCLAHIYHRHNNSPNYMFVVGRRMKRTIHMSTPYRVSISTSRKSLRKGIRVRIFAEAPVPPDKLTSQPAAISDAIQQPARITTSRSFQDKAQSNRLRFKSMGATQAISKRPLLRDVQSTAYRYACIYTVLYRARVLAHRNEYPCPSRSLLGLHRDGPMDAAIPRSESALGFLIRPVMPMRFFAYECCPFFPHRCVHMGLLILTPLVICLPERLRR